MKYTNQKENLLKIQDLSITSQSILKALKSIKKKSLCLKTFKKLENQIVSLIICRMKSHSNQWGLLKIVMNAELRYCKTMQKVKWYHCGIRWLKLKRKLNIKINYLLLFVMTISISMQKTTQLSLSVSSMSSISNRIPKISQSMEKTITISKKAQK